MPFVALARAAGLRPILGAEVDEPTGLKKAIVLARDQDGYRSLARLVTGRQLDPAFALVPALAARSAGLLVLGRDPALLEALAGALPRERLAVLVELTGRDRARDGARLGSGRRLGRELGIRVAGTPALRGVDPHEPELARLLAASRTGRLVTAITPATDPAGVPPALAIARRLGAEAADVLACGRELAADCEAALPGGTRIFPPPPCAPGEDPFALLLERCLTGLRERYRTLAPAPMARLMRELQVIAERGFLPYFLVVGDLVAAARAARVAVVGRGSGASSIVAYALGITNVDPLAHRLHFERFLSAARGDDLPDLDIDLDWRGRDRVIEHVYRTHGAERVAMIATYATFHPRSAFRDAARAHGIPVADVNRLVRRLPSALAAGPDAAAQLTACVRQTPGLAEHPWHESPWREILAGTAALLGLPRHLGIHPGGIVIADRPLAELVPLERAAKGIVVTQYAMEAIAAIGLVKIDLLGNRALSTVAEAAGLAVTAGGLESVPRGDRADPAVSHLLAAGDTLGCFQIESPGMRHLLSMLRPENGQGVVDALALIRPGPASSGMKERYVRRARGLEPAEFAHPALVPVLATTHGIPLYEEDVMGMAAAVAGIDLSAADSLRRAIAIATEPAARRTLENGFVARAVQAGVDPDRALAVWQEMARFAAYSFSRAHAAGYGVLAYQSAWLKVHHPAEFACAVLNHHQGMYPRWLHVEDARRHGVEIALPSVNASAAEFTLERPAGDRPRVRTGLGQVRGLSQATIDELLAARERDGPLHDLGDLRRRVAIGTTELQSLIATGALDGLGASRAALRFELYATRERKAFAKAAGPSLFAPDAIAEPGPPLRELALDRQLADEWLGLALSPRAHPLAILAPAWTERMSASGNARRGERGGEWPRGAPRARPIAAARLAGHLGERVAVAGLVAARRRTPTKSGRPMAFVTLDDPTGTAELTLFPAACGRARLAFAHAGPLVAIGRPEAHYGAVSLNVEWLAPLAEVR